MAKTDEARYRGRKAIREFEYHELMEIGKHAEALAIAEANQEWFEQEAQRWADLAGAAELRMKVARNAKKKQEHIHG